MEEEAASLNCEENFKTEGYVINHLLIAHVNKRLLVAENLIMERAEVSTIVVHISDDETVHDERVDLTPVAEIKYVDIGNSEGAKETIDADTEKDAKTLVGMKLANIFWSAKMVGKVDGELTEIELFDELQKKKITHQTQTI